MDEDPAPDAAGCDDHLAASPSGERKSGQNERKADRIREACATKDLERLIELATDDNGLISDELRRAAWPLLLGCRSGAQSHHDDWRSLPRHRDEDQVKLDVDRALVYEPQHQSEKAVEEQKQDLQNLITQTLRQHPALCYFQGYHDIVQVIMLVLGKAGAAEAVARLSLLRIRDFMLPTLEPAILHLHLLPSILRKADSDVARHLSHTEPFFALAATLTLYAHDIHEYGDIARLFDFLLAREAVISIYLFAVIIISRRTELLDIEADEPEMLHSVLCKLPKPLKLEQLISKTLELFEQNPPESLPSSNWFWIPSYSVLKTTRDPTSLTRQTLADGERFLKKQTSQVLMLRTLTKMKAAVLSKRRPAAAISVAVAIAVLAYWVRRESPVGLVGVLWQRLQGWMVRSGS